MEIFALIGPSGTGKSHHAPLVAYKYKIPYIIDDGLLIKGNSVIAGHSAKRELTRFGAIKRALFADPEHASEVRNALAKTKPERLLLLATSEQMAGLITKRLDLPQPTYYLTIEDIATPEAINAALKIREKENRHVVPLPTFAIKKDFPGYLIDPLISIFSRPARKEDSLSVERSIVRPIYSSYGNFYISERVVDELVRYVAGQVPGVHKVSRIEFKNGSKSTIDVDLVLTLELNPVQVLANVQHTIKEQIEYLTGFYLSEINVTAKSIHLEDHSRQHKD